MSKFSCVGNIYTYRPFSYGGLLAFLSHTGCWLRDMFWVLCSPRTEDISGCCLISACIWIMDTVGFFSRAEILVPQRVYGMPCSVFFGRDACYSCHTVAPLCFWVTMSGHHVHFDAIHTGYPCRQDDWLVQPRVTSTIEAETTRDRLPKGGGQGSGSGDNVNNGGGSGSRGFTVRRATLAGLQVEIQLHDSRSSRELRVPLLAAALLCHQLFHSGCSLHPAPLPTQPSLSPFR